MTVSPDVVSKVVWHFGESERYFVTKHDYFLLQRTVNDDIVIGHLHHFQKVDGGENAKKLKDGSNGLEGSRINFGRIKYAQMICPVFIGDIHMMQTRFSQKWIKMTTQ